MSQSLQTLISGLAQRRRLSAQDTIVFARFGYEAFDKLADAAVSVQSTPQQVTNALYVMAALVRERCPDRRCALLKLAIALMESEHRDVRSQAAVTAAGIGILVERFPELNQPLAQRANLESLLEEVLRKGVLVQDETFIRHYLSAGKAGGGKGNGYVDSA